MQENTHQTTPNPAPTQPAVAQNSLLRDLLIPASIVLAGVCVGLGLYFSGGAGATKYVGGPTDGQPTAPAGLSVAALAKKAGVKEKDFAECIQSDRLQPAVQEDVDNAVATGGRGTPWSILIGPGGKTYPINGALPQQNIEQLIELAKSEADQGPDKSAADGTTNAVSPVTEADHIRGNLDAPIKIVEYSDFDCPFCGRFHDAMKQVTEKYGPDQVAWVYRQFPLEQLHPNAPAVALASECVADLGGNDAFWTFADGYFSGT